MNLALADLRVLEIGHDVSAPYCGKLLADLGADVIKVEPRGIGDPLRRAGSFPGDEPDASTGGLFRYLNTNKRSIELDLSVKADADSLLSLAAGADLVIENLGAGILEVRGLGMDQLAKANPKIVLVRISDFGQTGPYSGIPSTDLTVQASASWVSSHKMGGQPLAQVGGRISDFATGAYAACAALTAWETASLRSEPASVDVSKQECLMACVGGEWLHLETLTALGRGSPEQQHFPFPGVVRCKDGLVSINCLTAQHFADCCNLAGVPEYISKQTELPYGGPEFDAFFKDIEPWLAERTVDEVVELCQAFRIPTVPVSDAKKLMTLPQLVARSFFTKDPEGEFDQPGFPYRMGLTPASLRERAPRLGEHNAALTAVAWRSPQTSPKASDARGGELPFEGIRVLDLGSFWAGPYVGCYLGSHGADVIKIESIQRPDGMRFNGAYPDEGPDWFERSGVFQHTNNNKRNLTLNLDAPEGKRLFERLIVRADVISENFSPRVLGNFGFGVERLRELNPNLIILRMPGFGLEGPWKEYVSFGMPLEQVSGMAWVTGQPDGPPMNLGGYADAMVGMHALVGLQAALHHRKRTGQAQFIEVPQIEAGVCMTGEQVIGYSMTGKSMGRIGNRSREMAPQGVYPCMEDEHVAISIRDDADWRNLVTALGSPDWAQDGRFSSFRGRQEDHDELDRLIGEWTSSRNADSVVDALRKEGLAVAGVLTPPNMVTEPNLVARGYYQELEHPISGPRRYPRWPWLQSRGPKSEHRFVAATLGQHNREILHNELGLSDTEIEDLATKEIIGTIPKGLG